MASYYAGSTLSAEQVASYLYQAGFRAETLVQLTAIAKRESGYVTGAHRTDSSRSALSGDRGLFQINSIHDSGLMAAGIIRSKADLFDPLANAKAAMWVFQKQGLAAWGAGAGGWQSGGDPFYGTDVEAARAAVNRAQQSGALSADWTQGGASGGAQTGGSASTATQVTLPTDARIVSTPSGSFAVFNLGGGNWIKYGVGETPGLVAQERLSTQQFAQRYGNPVNGGLVAELKNVRSTYGTYAKFWESILNQVLPAGSPARNDAGVIRVMAEFAGRPDMSEAELQNKLKGTTFWKSKTEAELQWNSLSPAEQAVRRNDTAAKMRQAYMQFGGVDIKLQHVTTNPYLEKIASGKMGYTEWVEKVLKPQQLANPESPWSREVRAEKETQRQRPIDVENTANQIRSTLQNWGLRWSEANMQTWALALVEKRKSDKDLLDTVRNQAKGLFPTKPPDLETSDWAAPWLEVYSRVMETEGDLFVPDIAKALGNGVNVWDFEKNLKKTPKWLETRNAREELFSVAAEAGARMGFV